MAYYLGIDIGTSATKALVMDAGGAVLATASSEYPCSSPRPLWSQQDPQHWWKATIAAVQLAVKSAGIDPANIAGIGLSGQMHGLVITDSAGLPLRPSIIWNDQRSAPQALQIEQQAGGRQKLIQLAGNVAVTSFTLTKLLWVRQHEPRIYDKIRHLLLPKDYIRLRLTGLYATDVSDASGTLLLDQRKRDWSGKMISLFQIDRDILPPVVESHEITGGLNASAAKALGLPIGVPVVGGGGDQPVGAVGSGVVAEGLISATIGTSGVVYVHSKDYRVDSQGALQTFCSCVAGQWCMFGCVLAAGGSLQWYRNQFGAAALAQAGRRKLDPYDLLVEQAGQALPGSEGLYWLPYLTGERTPHADPHAKACWIGITSRTTQNEMIRSVLEGVTFAMNDSVTLIGELGLPVRQIRLSGGGARSAFWRQLQADIFGRPCATINTQQGPAYGAAILAGVGTGCYRSVAHACQAVVRVTEKILPQRRLKACYAKRYAQYRRLYPALKDEFARIDALTK
jgi:xylulokinase